MLWYYGKVVLVIHYYILTQFGVICSSTSCLFCPDIRKNNALAICNTILLTSKTRIEIVERSCLLLLFCIRNRVNLNNVKKVFSTSYNIILQKRTQFKMIEIYLPGWNTNITPCASLASAGQQLSNLELPLVSQSSTSTLAIRFFTSTF